MPIGTCALIDPKFFHYKDETMPPGLIECPSQILRSSAINWFQTYQKFLKGECGKPKLKKKSSGGMVRPMQTGSEVFDRTPQQKNNFQSYLKYKAYRSQKACFKISAYQSSQNCALCSSTHPENCISQSSFICESRGHAAHADHDAAEVIKQQALKLMMHSGTELSKRGGVPLDTGRGAKPRPRGASVLYAPVVEESKKKRKAAKAA